MTARTRMNLPNIVPAGVALLLIVVGSLAAWYRATYHTWPGMMPTVVHWCGRDYESGETLTWAQITRAEAPRKVRVVGSYPLPLAGRPLLAAPVAGPVKSGEPCAMGVYVQTGPGRYQGYSLEGGP
jgi:hypothetical protein